MATTPAKPVWLLDYGAGNVRSVANAVRRLGYTLHAINSVEDFAAAEVATASAPIPSARPRTSRTACYGYSQAVQ